MTTKIIPALLAAFIWGVAFVAQSAGAGTVPPFTFNASRSLIAVATLGVFLLLKTSHQKRNSPNQNNRIFTKPLLIYGAICGTILTIACNLQQFGIAVGTDAGKASFITALYLVLVPLFGWLLGHRVTWLTGVSVALAMVGMYLLCLNQAFTIQTGDILIILCAFFFCAHILSIDRFAPQTDPIALSFVQFSVMTIESAILALICETPTWSGIWASILPILYVGIFSSGVAYTLQIAAQKDADPTIITLLLSLESVFGALAGAVVLHERMTPKELLGCGILLFAVLLSQIPLHVLVGWFQKRKK